MVELHRRWVRSWPANRPEFNPGDPLLCSHVVDDLPRLEVSGYDLASNPACWTVLRDCTLVEWDVALDADAMLRWESIVDETPGRIHVAPYRVYAGAHGYTSDGWMSRGDGHTATSFGFGMIWFPADVVDAFRGAAHHPHAGRFTDGTFSAWYSAAYGPALVEWSVEPVHLNYRVSVPSLP